MSLLTEDILLEKIRTKSLDVVETLIKSLSPEVMSIIEGGDESDVDNFIDELYQETRGVVNIFQNNLSDKDKFNDIGNLSDIIEETYRTEIFNYFIASTLPTFTMGWHNVEWGLLTQLYQNLSIQAARDHSKSYQFSFAYPLWKMYRYKRPGRGESQSLDLSLCKEGMLITNEYKLGRKHLKKIREEIEVNEILSKRLLPNKREGWGNEGITTLNGAELTLGSFGTSLRGPHPGYIITDDFLDKSALYSSEQREKFIETFNSEIMNMILKHGQVINIGTPFHEEDLFGILKKDKKWSCFEYPGILPNGDLLDDIRHDYQEILDKRESLGPIIFTREILVQPVSDASTIFPYDLISKCFDNNAILVPSRLSLQRDFVRIVIGVDLARSANVGADYTVITVLGIDDFNRYHLLNLTRVKGLRLSAQIGKLKTIYYDFAPEIIVVENNQMQQFFVDEAEDHGLPVEPHTTGVNKYDLDKGLPSLAILFEQLKIVIPRGDQFSRDITDILVSELTSITWTDKGKLEGAGAHDDTVMSLLMAVIAARKGTGFSLGFA